jgi:hypothetical protein
MMTGADPLKAFFDAGAAPRIDPVFRMGVMEKVARRRLLLELGVRALGILLAAVIVFVLSPSLVFVLEVLGDVPLEVYAALFMAGLVALAGQYLATHRIGFELPFARFLF